MMGCRFISLTSQDAILIHNLFYNYLKKQEIDQKTTLVADEPLGFDVLTDEFTLDVQMFADLHEAFSCIDDEDPNHTVLVPDNELLFPEDLHYELLNLKNIEEFAIYEKRLEALRNLDDFMLDSNDEFSEDKKKIYELMKQFSQIRHEIFAKETGFVPLNESLASQSEYAQRILEINVLKKQFEDVISLARKIFFVDPDDYDETKILLKNSVTGKLTINPDRATPFFSKFLSYLINDQQTGIAFSVDENKLSSSMYLGLSKIFENNGVFSEISFNSEILEFFNEVVAPHSRYKESQMKKQAKYLADAIG